MIQTFQTFSTDDDSNDFKQIILNLDFNHQRFQADDDDFFFQVMDEMKKYSDGQDLFYRPHPKKRVAEEVFNVSFQLQYFGCNENI